MHNLPTVTLEGQLGVDDNTPMSVDIDTSLKTDINGRPICPRSVYVLSRKQSPNGDVKLTEINRVLIIKFCLVGRSTYFDGDRDKYIHAELQPDCNHIQA